MWTRNILVPVMNTTYYLPASGSYDLKLVENVIFIVLADQACSMWIETSTDGATFTELDGFRLPLASWSNTTYNSILLTEPLRYARVAVLTGPVAPSAFTIAGMAK